RSDRSGAGASLDEQFAARQPVVLLQIAPTEVIALLELLRVFEGVVLVLPTHVRNSFLPAALSRMSSVHADRLHRSTQTSAMPQPQVPCVTPDRGMALVYSGSPPESNVRLQGEVRHSAESA